MKLSPASRSLFLAEPLLEVVPDFIHHGIFGGSGAATEKSTRDFTVEISLEHLLLDIGRRASRQNTPRVGIWVPLANALAMLHMQIYRAREQLITLRGRVEL